MHYNFPFSKRDGFSLSVKAAKIDLLRERGKTFQKRLNFYARN